MMLENVDSLLEAWFKDQVKSVQIPCVHCISEHLHPPHLFDLQECTVAVTKGQKILHCKVDNAPVRIGK